MEWALPEWKRSGGSRKSYGEVTKMAVSKWSVTEEQYQNKEEWRKLFENWAVMIDAMNQYI